jgi:sulfatase modifying factor 1
VSAVRTIALFAALALIAIAGSARAAPFRDCRDCPDMVAIPPGTFVMGTDVPPPPAPPPGPSTTNAFGNARMRAGPAHVVRITRAFALGRYEITRAEFARFITDSHYAPAANCNGLDDHGEYTRAASSWDKPGFAQTERDPVLCVSWTDAQAYVAWLSRKTGHHYRLPSDAEWEYAERAGGPNTAFWWGEKLDDSCLYANLADLDAPYPTWLPAKCHDGFATSAPAGFFRPNAFGLYDMAGNAWEFLQDCAHEGYTAEAPTDGSAWEGGGCGALRLRRGGSFDHGAAEIGSATFRLAQDIAVRKGNSGFRIARDY